MYIHYFSQKKIILILCLFLLFSLYLLSVSSNLLVVFYQRNPISCYRATGESLSDISSVTVRKGKSIFFHETSCNSYKMGKITISSRQACAVESAALLNPHMDVYLLFTSTGTINNYESEESDRFLQALQSYKNVYIHHLDYKKYTEGTPVEELYKGGKIENSDYAMSHASDVLRYLTLWKYGGTYLDLDVVVTKSLEDLPPNFAGLESATDVAAGIINFESNGTGHNLAADCVMDLKNGFRGDIWGHNGPGVITRLTKKRCGVKRKKILDYANKDCGGFQVYLPKMFYAIPWNRWQLFFDENKLNEVKRLTSESYLIHVWNKHSSTTKIPIDKTNVPYLHFAKNFCPLVYEQCDSVF